MKIGFGAVATLPLSTHDPFSTPHFFAFNAVEKESRQRVAQFTTSVASHHIDHRGQATVLQRTQGCFGAESSLFQKLHFYKLPAAVGSGNDKFRFILVGSLVQMTPMLDRSGDVPATP
jgi:hypothetical protein